MAERNRVIQHAMGGGGGGSESESEEGHVSSANALPCSHPTCHSSSLLSFKCDACVRAFCLAHRLPHAHQCPNMAAANHTIIELNASAWRLDMDWRWWKLAKQKGVITSINPDAHSTEGLQALIYGIKVARKGWLCREDVINCLPLDEVKKALGHKTGR